MEFSNGTSNRVFLIGGSAGSIEATRDLLALLPADFPCPVLVVIHTGPQSSGLLAKVLQRRAKLVVLTAEERMNLEPGYVYVGPADRHLTVENCKIRLRRGPVENRLRPAIDSLFSSAARAFGARAVGIILSGYLDDGSAGLHEVKQSGGVAIVQDPEDAVAPDMPLNAIERVHPVHKLAVPDIASLMARLAYEPVVAPDSPQVPKIAEVSESPPGKLGRSSTSRRLSRRRGAVSPLL